MSEKETNRDKFNPDNYLRSTIIVKTEISTTPITIVSAVDIQRVEKKIESSLKQNRRERGE